MVLVARPAPHLAPTLAALEAEGLTGTTLALSHPTSAVVQVPPHTTALIATSPLALEALKPYARTLPLYAVGVATAEAGRAAGFPIAYTGCGGAEELAENLLNAALAPQHFLHAHGDNALQTTREDWYRKLETAGHNLTPLQAYTLNPVDMLPEDVCTTLRQKSLTTTLLFSAGSARHLANLLKQANIPLTPKAVALSPAVAEAAQPHWPQVTVAQTPTLAAMVTQALHQMKKDPGP